MIFHYIVLILTFYLTDFSDQHFAFQLLEQAATMHRAGPQHKSDLLQRIELSFSQIVRETLLRDRLF